MSKNVTLWGASYSNVPALIVPQTGGGTARFTDTSPTTAVDADVAQGKIYFKADGTQSTGTGSGGGGGMQIDSIVAEPMSAGSLVFTNLRGEPTSFYLLCLNTIATSSVPKVAALSASQADGFHIQTITNTSNAQVTHATSGVAVAYNAGTFTLSASGMEFVLDDNYALLYTYGGADVGSKEVQVGSGATSITFTDFDDEPDFFYLIFTSNFSTSSGYQRVIAVANNGVGLSGLEMDSSAHYSGEHWSYTYNNGSLTITSQGTNAGGYFHQPGYYHLTYGNLGGGSYQTKSVSYTPTTQTQTQRVTADSGYDALKAVNVTVNPIPSSYVQPTTTVGATTYRASTSAQTIQSGTYHSAAATIAAVSQTNLTAENIKSGTTISISNGQSNLWSVTGTYTGGGGGGSFSVATTTWNNSTNTTTSHQFTGLSGTPKFAVLRCTSQLTRSSSNTYYYIADIVWNGTDAYGNYHLRSNGSFNNVASNATTKFTVTTGTNSITFTSGGSRSGAPGSFYNGTYELTYIY